MEHKGKSVYLAVFPTMAICLLALVITVLRLILTDSGWIDGFAWVVAIAAAINPGMLLVLVPMWVGFSKMRDRHTVREAVTAEGVGRDTLDRCAAIVESKANHPIAACLRDYCGDVGAPPDKFVEMPGLGVSAQFSNQLIHAGSAEYLRGLKIEVPDIPGTVAHIALEGRALGYYRFRTPSDMERVKTRLLRAAVVCCAFKIALWVLLALTGTNNMAAYTGFEAASMALGIALMQSAVK